MGKGDVGRRVWVWRGMDGGCGRSEGGMEGVREVWKE